MRERPTNRSTGSRSAPGELRVVEAARGLDNAADDHPQAARRCAPHNHANAAAKPVGKQACLRSRF